MHSSDEMHIDPQYPVSSEVGAGGEWTTRGIDFADYSRMGTFQQKLNAGRRKAAPFWANNDTLLREVVIHFLENRARITPGNGTMVVRLARACAEINKDRHRQKLVLAEISKRYVELKRQITSGTPAPELRRANVRELARLEGLPDFMADAVADSIDKKIKKRLRALEIQIENADTALRHSGAVFANIPVGVVYYYWRCGMNSVQTAEQLGMKPPHVRQIIWRLNKTWAAMQSAKVARSRTAARLDYEQAKQLFISGMPVSEIATTCGVTTGAVRHALKQMGFEPNETKPAPEPVAPKPASGAQGRPPFTSEHHLDTTTAIELHSAGFSISAIARQMGFSTPTVWHALREAGVKTERQRGTRPPDSPDCIKKHMSAMAALAESNNGLVPPYVWLRDNGFFRSYEVMMANPEQFKHLKRETAYNSGVPEIEKPGD